jgi:hypothetical protein
VRDTLKFSACVSYHSPTFDADLEAACGGTIHTCTAQLSPHFRKHALSNTLTCTLPTLTQVGLMATSKMWVAMCLLQYCRCCDRAHGSLSVGSSRK